MRDPLTGHHTYTVVRDDGESKKLATSISNHLFREGYLHAVRVLGDYFIDKDKDKYTTAKHMEAIMKCLQNTAAADVLFDTATRDYDVQFRYHYTPILTKTGKKKGETITATLEKVRHVKVMEVVQ